MDVGVEEMCKVIVTAAGGAATVVLTPAILATLGFTPAGIVASSVAAKLMSLFAYLYGGGVPAGGLVAFLQSLGAAGLSWSGFGFLFGTGGGLGWMLSTICNRNITISEE